MILVADLNSIRNDVCTINRKDGKPEQLSHVFDALGLGKRWTKAPTDEVSYKKDAECRKGGC
jgi:hypothetical protein